MKKISLLIIILTSLALYKCASTSTAPAEKQEEAKGFEKIENKAIIYLFRPGRAVGAAVQTQIKINGKDAGGTGPGTFFKWELEPGTYVISCFTPESSAALEIDAKPNKLYFIRQDIRIGVNSGRVTLVEVDESTGINAVKSSKMLISTYR